jgi:hypothetical protein
MNAHEIRIKLFKDLPIEDLDDLKFINDVISWFKKNNMLRDFDRYRLHLVKNLNDNKKNEVVADFGIVKVKREKIHKYHVCLEKRGE